METDETLKRLNALFAKLYGEEDYKAAAGVQQQIYNIQIQTHFASKSEKDRILSHLK